MKTVNTILIILGVIGIYLINYRIKEGVPKFMPKVVEPVKKEEVFEEPCGKEITYAIATTRKGYKIVG